MVAEKPLAKKCAGRPRDEQARCRILAAANALLEEKGFRATTVEGIAERAGTSKVTIYRWWSSKAGVVLEAFLEYMAQRVPYRESASALADMHAQMAEFAEIMDGSPGTLLASLLAESVLDAEVYKEYVEHWIKPRRRDARRHLERAIANQELPAGVDLEMIIDALYGPIYLRLVQRHAPLSRTFANAVWRSVFSGVL